MATASPIASARRSTELSLVVMAGDDHGRRLHARLARRVRRDPGPHRPVPRLLLGCSWSPTSPCAGSPRGADGTLLPLAALLHGIGYVMITRLDERLAGLQTTWSIVAIAGFIATLVVVQRAPDLARYRWSFLFVGIGLLLLPMVPGLGFGVGGARIWVSLGPINFQPGEFAKLALAIFFAGYLAENRELIAAGTWRSGRSRLPEPRHLLPILLAWGFAVVVMVGQRDLGSSLLFFALFVVMMWVATERAELPGARARPVRRRGVRVVADVRPRPDPRRHLARPVVASARQGLPDRAGAVRAVRRRHRRHRPRPRQPEQVPEAQNDFIFTAIGEELGLFGAAAVLMAYLLLIGAGLRTALRTDNTFEKLLAVGLTTILGVQAFIIIGGVIKLVPLTGITLPFVSYGGSSLLSNYILLALLIRLSDSGARRLHELPDDPTPAERWAACRLRRDATAALRDRRWLAAREPPDPPARRRPDGLLRRCCSSPSTTGRSAARRSSTPRSTTPAPSAASSTGRAARSSPPTASSSPSRWRTRRSSEFAYQRSTRPATCSPTSPATTRSPSARRSSSARRTTC